ncbi:MAG: hypothetical protein NTW07_08780 [candidate division Zixibacteria bacterium]|nr:hypothetical protein [candidate division Zixibacteria bacterium]
MLAQQTSRVASGMIYFGTFLVSVLSFFTTYLGLTIFLDRWLAVIGSLGLQIAMLGIAWNLMRMRKNRLSYVFVFFSVAAFSMFFSYANFNNRLKGEVRQQEARAAYADAARPVLRDYAALSKKAVSQGDYQVQRLKALLAMEETKGWATIIDEGSNDPFLQSVIEGARRTVESWNKHEGAEYQQGSGRGIILDYLHNWQNQIDGHLTTMVRYMAAVDSISLLVSSDVPVVQQYDMVNWAAVHFPQSEYKMILAAEPNLKDAPFTSKFVERPANGQEALSMVIADLARPDRLTTFSIVFAVVIDLVVLILALCGSRAAGGLDDIFRKFEQDASQRMKKLPMDDPRQFTESMQQNIEWLRQASEYGKNLEQVLSEFQQTRDRITLIRGEERTEKQPTPPRGPASERKRIVI